MRQLRSWILIAAMIVAALQTAALLVMIEQRAAILRDGRSIVLLTKPVDPRDLMRGDYVRLGYEISTVPLESVVGKAPPAGEPAVIYVATEERGDGRWHLTRASWEPITDPKPGEVVLAGRTQSPFSRGPGTTLQVEYGIERYYIPQGAGRRIEDAERNHRLDAVVAVARDGTAQIRALKENGAEIYQEPFY